MAGNISERYNHLTVKEIIRNSTISCIIHPGKKNNANIKEQIACIVFRILVVSNAADDICNRTNN